MDKIKELLTREFAAVAYLFLEQPIRGIDMKMPDDALREKVQSVIKELNLHVNDKQSAEITLADKRLKDEYGEDWLTYRDDRLKELEYERGYIHSTVPNTTRRTVDGETRPEGTVGSVS